jgi:hypothetical protein
MLLLLALAEVLFWGTEIQLPGQLTHTVRLQLNTPADVARYGVVTVPYSPTRGQTLLGLRAATVLPNGHRLPVPAEAIFDTAVVKRGDHEQRTLSWAFSALEPGAVVEYEYTECHADGLPLPLRLPLQRELPVRSREVTVPAGLLAHYRNCQNCRTHLPAYREEPDAPAGGLAIVEITLPPETTWSALAAELAARFEAELASAPVAAPGDLETLAELCRTRIQNVLYRTDNLTLRGAPEPNPTPADTWRRGYGTPHEINLLFAALARAAGHQVFYAQVVNRPDLPDPSQLQSELIAVRQPHGYAFFNPGVPYLSAGLLDFDEEGRTALVATPAGPEFVTLPRSSTCQNRTERTAHLLARPDGSVHGAITLTYSGHAAALRKRRAERQSPAERLAALRQEFPGALIENVEIENLALPAAPVRIRFQVTVSDYADRSPRRLFFPGRFFARFASTRYPAAGRTQPVEFPFAFSVHDTVTLVAPSGHQRVFHRGLEQERLRYSPAEFPELYQKWVTFEDAGREVFLMERLP